MKHLRTRFSRLDGTKSGSSVDPSVAEVEQIHDKVDRELKEKGLPSDEELRQEIAVMNEGAD
jgi:hypothetical protein